MFKYKKAIEDYCAFHTTKMTEEEVTEIMKLYLKGYSYKEINRKCNLKHSSDVVASILSREEKSRKKKSNKPHNLKDFLANTAYKLEKEETIDYMVNHFNLEHHESELIYKIWRKNFMISNGLAATRPLLNIDKKILCLQYIEKGSVNQGGI